MRQLTKDNFHRTVSENACVVVEFLATAAGPSALEQLREQHAGTVFGRVDVQAQPELAAMFGLSEGPALLIFREKVVLYLDKGEHSAERVDELLGRALALDMDQVRPQIEEQQRAEVALRMRRVCPATRRGGPIQE